MIPLGKYHEHEIAVLNPKVLLPVILSISLDGKTHQQFNIPRDQKGNDGLFV